MDLWGTTRKKRNIDFRIRRTQESGMDLERMNWKEEINEKWGKDVWCVVIPKLHGKEAVNVPRPNMILGKVLKYW